MREDETDARMARESGERGEGHTRTELLAVTATSADRNNPREAVELWRRGDGLSVTSSALILEKEAIRPTGC